MEELAAAILRFADSQTGLSPYITPIRTMAVMRTDHPKPPAHLLMQPALCIVAQGAKWASFGDRQLAYKAGQALVVGVETPSVGRVVEASPGKPCLVLAVELDLAVMRSVADDMRSPPVPRQEPALGVFVTDFQGPLSDCALRLMRLLDTPEAIPTLYPVIMREICYWLLSGPHGSEIARMTLGRGPSQRLLDAVHALRDRFRETLRVAELAAIAQMSQTVFHRHFKTLTSLTPLQYQKRLRLLDARRLMITSGMNAESASVAVGYESPSQFSREYTRMFGTPPKRDAMSVAVFENQ
ncbi:AraC family transcriptional regulator [Bordetella sp. N]|uniref:AraC family transcriptional regulator n=1 Tax=Bordetella sp. N TaxID=1746199 RepID=UPI00070B0E89|nr:AraC family transcriptional regulator [Bordetella sp. N]ALM82245.1 AraC family transcriptional regulator [Bordetella sp. N]